MRTLAEPMAMHVAIWNEKGVYRETTLDQVRLINRAVLEVERTKYIGRTVQRDVHAVRISFEGGETVEVRSIFLDKIDPIAAEFEQRKGVIL